MINDKTIIMNLIEGLKMMIDTLEKLSHEPQNYKKKCEVMERRIEKLGVLYESNQEVVMDIEARLSKLENIITEMTNENKEPT